jgi:hypothetical protein
MKHKNEIADIKLTKILEKKSKKKKNNYKENTKTVNDIINEIPQKYHSKFWEELGDKKPSRRDVDLFLRKYKLTKK